MASVLAMADFDLPTRSASGFLLRWIAPRLEPAHLYASLNRRELFKLATPQADLMIIMGHGQPGAIYGQRESELLRVGNYDPKMVAGKVIKLFSCKTGIALGPDLIRNGALAVLAYTDDYIWVMDSDSILTPWADKIAAPTLMPVIDSLNVLLDGQTVGEAFEVEQANYLKNEQEEDNELVKATLRFNHDNNVLLGDPGVRVGKRPNLLLPFKIVPPPPLLPLGLLI